MKSLSMVVAIFLMAIFSVNAQDVSEHSLGLRIGDNDGMGAEISYQAGFSETTRLEVDLGFRSHDNSSAFKLTGLYEWVWLIDGGLNWYAGFGAGVGSWSNKNEETGTKDDGFFINADGVVGIEYDFEIPLLISLDLRPEFGLVGHYGNDADLDIALSVRYQF